MDALWDLLTGIEASVGFGIIIVVAVGAMFITRKDIREVNRPTAKA